MDVLLDWIEVPFEVVSSNATDKDKIYRNSAQMRLSEGPAARWVICRYKLDILIWAEPVIVANGKSIILGLKGLLAKR